MPQREIFAPRVMSLTVDGVELYNEGDSISLSFQKSVSCLVGANGVGKSTLIALLNFAITGLVPRPNAAFPSMDEFASSTVAFARSYFTGRVRESERELAQVAAQYRLGEVEVEVARGLFDGRLIRSFRTSGPGAVNAGSDAGVASAEITELYQQAVTELSGFATFDQFSFWQLYVMTFDERRHLLFWEPKTLSGSLMLALGRSPDDAANAESLGRQIARQESLAGNARWEATKATNKKNRLLRVAGTANEGVSATELASLEAEHDRLRNAHSGALDAHNGKAQELNDVSRQLAELALQEADLQLSFSDALGLNNLRPVPEHHPVVARILRDSHCDICGTSRDELKADVVESLEAHACPLCGSPTDQEPQVGDDLAAIDEQLGEVRSALAESRSRYRRLSAEVEELETTVSTISSEYEGFLVANSRALSTTSTTSSDDEILRLDIRIAEALQETQAHRAMKETLRVQLEPIMDGLESAYQAVEHEFVPAFRRLAGQFIGRDVSIEFERSSDAIGLRFEMEGQSRRLALELSESQQFFLDIALRMTLTSVFLGAQGTLLIDTPEGSLDIAYETRAGQLFSEFAQGGGALLTTSNLNSSRLLLELAQRSNSSELELFRMTDWVQLSDVQLESAGLFEAAFNDLERALN